MAFTRQMLVGYLQFRLELGGHNPTGHSSPVLRGLFTDVIKSQPGNTLIQLGKGIEMERCNKVFMDRIVGAISLGNDASRKEYFCFLNNWFFDREITWGRLAMVLVFTACLAERAVCESKFASVSPIMDWCEEYFAYNGFEEWVSISGGWDALPKIYKQNTCGPISKFYSNLPDSVTIGYRLLTTLSAAVIGLLMVRSVSKAPMF